jgi:hypothetical protein
MQRWEHLVLVVRNETVLAANRQQLGKAGFLGRTDGPVLHEYLDMCGADGWEVVAMAPVTQLGNLDGAIDINIILKRPRS